MRVAAIGYRDWALRIYDQLATSTDHQYVIIRSKSQYDESVLRDFKPDLILFYGWSWKISSDLLSDFPCIMLHPSPLPKYRGGSPLQNQLIRGETESAVTLFRMDEGLDTGPILAQAPLSLSGNLSDIFERITVIGTELTFGLLANGLDPSPQNHNEATFFPRRQPAESEITLAELQEKPASYLHNKIRMLQDPYPNAFIKTADGKKLIITQATIEDAS
jgi:methionyl-tRNA formyltransferase